MDEDSLLVKILAGELHYAKLWLVCVALRGVSWDKMPFEQRELAFQAKDAALNCLNIFLGSQDYRAALRYAVHDGLVTAAFSGLFLLKMASLFPTELDLPGITSQVEQLAQLLSEVAAERRVFSLLFFALPQINDLTDMHLHCASCLPTSDARWASRIREVRATRWCSVASHRASPSPTHMRKLRRLSNRPRSRWRSSGSISHKVLPLHLHSTRPISPCGCRNRA
jgi:hypothetical protein